MGDAWAYYTKGDPWATDGQLMGDPWAGNHKVTGEKATHTSLVYQNSTPYIHIYRIIGELPRASGGT